MTYAALFLSFLSGAMAIISFTERSVGLNDWKRDAAWAALGYVAAVLMVAL
jgi:hypothetical protein